MNDDVTGQYADERLADAIRTRLGARHPVAAVATVVGTTVRVAVVGAEADADFELGSISKGITGSLYADALERGEVRGSTTLGELLPLGGTAVADVTLAALSTHTSGLPGLPRGAQPIRGSVRLLLRGVNPYGQSLSELLEQARDTPLSPPRPKYSNLGFQLLGHAVAGAAGRTYRDLLQERIAGPLGLAGMYAASTSADLRSTALAGRSRGGRTRQPWTGEALSPAGGIRASVADAGHLVHALLAGTAPGMTALDPVRAFAGPAVRIGAGWFVSAVRGREITWHNGGTGGFRSWMGLDRTAGAGVVVLTATDIPVDRDGLAILHELVGTGV